MKAKKARLLLRMRARWIAEYDELFRMIAPMEGIHKEHFERLVRLKGRIATVEERLRQNGYSWEVGQSGFPVRDLVKLAPGQRGTRPGITPSGAPPRMRRRGRQYGVQPSTDPPRKDGHDEK